MKWSCLLKDFGVSIPTSRRYVFISPGYPRPSQQYKCGMLSVQTAGKLDAGCKFSASPAQRLPRGCSTDREPPISHHCLCFVDGFLHTIIIILSICATSFEKQ